MINDGRGRLGNGLGKLTSQGSPYVRYLDMTGRNSTLIMVSLVYSKDLTGKYWRTVLPRVIINYYMRMLST